MAYDDFIVVVPADPPYFVVLLLILNLNLDHMRLIQSTMPPIPHPHFLKPLKGNDALNFCGSGFRFHYASYFVMAVLLLWKKIKFGGSDFFGVDDSSLYKLNPEFVSFFYLFYFFIFRLYM